MIYEAPDPSVRYVTFMDSSSPVLDPYAVVFRIANKPPVWEDHLAPFMPLIYAELVILGLAWLLSR